MHYPVMKWMIFIQKKVLKKHFKILRCLMYSIFQVIIICPDQRVTKIPGILSKNIICHIKAQCTQTSLIFSYLFPPKFTPNIAWFCVILYYKIFHFALSQKHISCYGRYCCTLLFMYSAVSGSS